jgi:hypothetical protein
LQPLRPWVTKLESPSVISTGGGSGGGSASGGGGGGGEFAALEELLAPVMRVVVLVWRSAPHFCQPKRLEVLVRRIGNALIRQVRCARGLRL